MKSKVRLFLMGVLMLLPLILSSCKASGKESVPSEFVGKWESQINPHQKVVLTIEENGKYKLTIYQSNERYDAIYSGEVVEIDQNTLKLPSDNYTREFNDNRNDSDPYWSFVTVVSFFYLRSDGAFSKTEIGLDNPFGYLTKTY